MAAEVLDRPLIKAILSQTPIGMAYIAGAMHAKYPEIGMLLFVAALAVGPIVAVLRFRS